MERTEAQELDLIIQGCIRNSDKSRELLYKKFYGYAMSVALLYTHHRAEAAGVVNDSFLRIFSAINRYDASRPFKLWLRRIVINASIDQLRRNKQNFLSVDGEAVIVPDSTSGSIGKLAAEDIIRLLDKLPHLHKTVFCLYEIEGYNHEEIAAQLAIPVSSSRVYLTRAKQQLRELLPEKTYTDD